MIHARAGSSIPFGNASSPEWLVVVSSRSSQFSPGTSKIFLDDCTDSRPGFGQVRLILVSFLSCFRIGSASWAAHSWR